MMAGGWPLFINDKDVEVVVHGAVAYVHDKLLLSDLLLPLCYVGSPFVYISIDS